MIRTTSTTYVNIHTHSSFPEVDEMFVYNINLNDSRIPHLPDNCYASIGLHPWNIDETRILKDLKRFSTNASNNKIITIGEIGLDKYIKIPMKTQVRIMEHQLATAQELRKPVIIHCVKAFQNIIAIRKNADLSLPWIFHGFNAVERIARELVELNCYLSLGRSLYNQKSKPSQYLKNFPLNRVFLETDENQMVIKDIYKQASIVTEKSMEELLSVFSVNFNKLFQDQ